MLHQPVPDQRFPRGLVLSVMKRLVDERLGAMEYSPACSAVATELSESIKEAVKSLSSGRYKLICCVAIGQLHNSAVSCSSRSIWNPDTDTFTEYLFKNQHLFTLCVLFAVYQEQAMSVPELLVPLKIIDIVRKFVLQQLMKMFSIIIIIK